MPCFSAAGADGGLKLVNKQKTEGVDADADHEEPHPFQRHAAEDD